MKRHRVDADETELDLLRKGVEMPFSTEFRFQRIVTIISTYMSIVMNNKYELAYVHHERPLSCMSPRPCRGKRTVTLCLTFLREK
jgi:hypothetical protein